MIAKMCEGAKTMSRADELYKATIFTFLAEHNLTWLFGFVIVVFLIGIALIFISKIKNIKMYKKKTSYVGVKVGYFWLCYSNYDLIIIYEDKVYSIVEAYNKNIIKFYDVMR